MLYSAFDLEFKADSATGELTGLASVYGNVDQGGDLIEPGAFTRTLQQKGAERPLLWQHDPRNPIGMCSLTDTPKGLALKGRLFLDLEAARNAHVLLKGGAVRGLSIGFQALREKMVSGVRHLQEIKLYEVSLVTFPMNEQATVTGVKAAEQNEIRQALASLRSGVLDALQKGTR